MKVEFKGLTNIGGSVLFKAVPKTVPIEFEA